MVEGGTGTSGRNGGGGRGQGRGEGKVRGGAVSGERQKPKTCSIQ